MEERELERKCGGWEGERKGEREREGGGGADRNTVRNTDRERDICST